MPIAETANKGDRERGGKGWRGGEGELQLEANEIMKMATDDFLVHERLLLCVFPLPLSSKVMELEK